VKRNISSYILCAFILLFMMKCQPCQKDMQIPYSLQHSFSQQINLYPYSKYYKVGDTIWLEVKTNNKTLFDTIHQQKISADSIALGFSVVVTRRYLPGSSTNIHACDFIDTANLNAGFTTTGYNDALYFNFGCNSDTEFSFIVGIVLAHTGIFSFDLGRNNVSSCFPGGNNSLIFSSIDYKFNLNDCNKDIYLSIPDASRGESVPGYTASLIDQKQVFVFQVQ
jgi:hypothetical protein